MQVCRAQVRSGRLGAAPGDPSRAGIQSQHSGLRPVGGARQGQARGGAGLQQGGGGAQTGGKTLGLRGGASGAGPRPGGFKDGLGRGVAGKGAGPCGQQPMG